MSHPKFCNISNPLNVAACPAPSASYPITTFSQLLLKSLPCASVKAVPSDATALLIPLWWSETASIYPSTIIIVLGLFFFAKLYANKCLPLLYTISSGEFMYLGLLSSKTLPPKAITLSLASNIGNISLFLNLSINFPSWFLFTRHDASISSSVKPLECSSV